MLNWCRELMFDDQIDDEVNKDELMRMLYAKRPNMETKDHLHVLGVNLIGDGELLDTWVNGGDDMQLQ